MKNNRISAAIASGRPRAMVHPRHFFGSIDGFPWLASAMLAFESCEVIRLRLTMFATGGDDAGCEARLMVNEKVDAMFEAGASLMAGASAAAVIGRYRAHVAANTRRLSAI